MWYNNIENMRSKSRAAKQGEIRFLKLVGIKEFYNIVGHTTFAMNTPKKDAVVMTEFGPLFTSTGHEQTADVAE